jgi:hypothetical protein
MTAFPMLHVIGENNRTKPKSEVVMKHCTSCGRSNDDDSRFCEACGQTLGAGSVGQVAPGIAPAGVPSISLNAPELHVSEAKGLIRALFDFRFHSLVTTRIIRIVYVVVTVLYSLGAVIDLVFAIHYGGAIGTVVGIIFIPIGYLISLAIFRIFCEIIIVLFRIGENVQTIARQGAMQSQSSPPSVP